MEKDHCIKYARILVSENPYSRVFYAVNTLKALQSKLIFSYNAIASCYKQTGYTLSICRMLKWEESSNPSINLITLDYTLSSLCKICHNAVLFRPVFSCVGTESLIL